MAVLLNNIHRSRNLSQSYPGGVIQGRLERYCAGAARPWVWCSEYAVMPSFLRAFIGYFEIGRCNPIQQKRVRWVRQRGRYSSLDLVQGSVRYVLPWQSIFDICNHARLIFTYIFLCAHVGSVSAPVRLRWQSKQPNRVVLHPYRLSQHRFAAGWRDGTGFCFPRGCCSDRTRTRGLD